MNEKDFGLMYEGLQSFLQEREMGIWEFDNLDRPGEADQRIGFMGNYNEDEEVVRRHLSTVPGQRVGELVLRRRVTDPAEFLAVLSVPDAMTSNGETPAVSVKDMLASLRATKN